MEIVTEQPRPAGTEPKAELLRALGRLVRGLSALFWGLPAALVICVMTALATPGTEPLRRFGVLPPLVATGWLVYGLWQLGHFQKQERIWIKALDRATWLALINFGLSPFLFWWSRRSDVEFFQAAVEIMAVGALVFLTHLNLVLHRLSAMLPDENLREETRQFTIINRVLLLGILAFGAALLLVLRHPAVIPVAGRFIELAAPSGVWVILFLALLPLAITLALIWKIKEVILASVFGA